MAGPDLSVNAAPSSTVHAEEIRAIPVRHPGRWITAVLVLLFVVWVARLFALSPNIDWDAVREYLAFSTILSGLRMTIVFSIVAQLVGVVLGVALATMRMSKNPVLSAVSWGYIWLFRGTPALLQIIFWFNIALVLPTLWIGVPFTDIGFTVRTNVLITTFVAGVLGLGLNEGAYMAEIVRGGIQSVDQGQTEAAQALGMSRGLTMRRIVLPQAMRAIIPPTGNEFIAMLKSSSLVSVIAGAELLTEAQNIYSRNYLTIELLIVASIWYLLLTTIATIGQSYVERYFARGATREPPPTAFQRLRRALVRPRSGTSSSPGPKPPGKEAR